MDLDKRKAYRLSATREFISNFLAGRLNSYGCLPTDSIPEEFNQSYVYYDGEKDLFQCVYGTDETIEGVCPEQLDNLTYIKEEVISKQKVRDAIQKLIREYNDGTLFDVDEYAISLFKELNLGDEIFPEVKTPAEKCPNCDSEICECYNGDE